MKKYTMIAVFLFVATNASAQTDSFDVYYFQPPTFFNKAQLLSKVQFSLTNSDTSFCTLLLYKNQLAKHTVLLDVKSQWKDFIFNKLAKADKTPARIYTQQMWDGWASTIAIGNFYHNKKKCVVMLSSFKKDKRTACVVYLFSDKTYKPVIENFSLNLHLKQ